MGRSVREKSCHPKRSRLYWSWSAMRRWVYTHRIHKWGERHGPALAGKVWGAKFSETAVIPHSSLKRTPRVVPCSFSAIFFDLLHGNQKPLTVTKSCSLAFFGHFLRFSVRQTPPLYWHMESAPAFFQPFSLIFYYAGRPTGVRLKKNWRSFAPFNQVCSFELFSH